jgi:translation elongation factor EF-4
MKKIHFKNCLYILLILVSLQTNAQEEEKGEFKHFRISPVLSHTYIPTATSEGTKTIIVPSIGLDLEYWFSEKYGIGLHNDLELFVYEIEKPRNELTVEREYPVVITLDGLAKVYKDLVLVFGAGVELEKNENLFIIRVGLEYEIEFAENWDLSPTFIYDYRKDEFATWSIGLGVGRRF